MRGCILLELKTAKGGDQWLVVVVLVCNMSLLAGVGAGDSSQWRKGLFWVHERRAGRALAVRWKTLDSGVTGPYILKVHLVSWERYKL